MRGSLIFHIAALILILIYPTMSCSETLLLDNTDINLKHVNKDWTHTYIRIDFLIYNPHRKSIKLEDFGIHKGRIIDYYDSILSEKYDSLVLFKIYKTTIYSSIVEIDGKFEIPPKEKVALIFLTLSMSPSLKSPIGLNLTEKDLKFTNIVKKMEIINEFEEKRWPQDKEKVSMLINKERHLFIDGDHKIQEPRETTNEP